MVVEHNKPGRMTSKYIETAPAKLARNMAGLESYMAARSARINRRRRGSE